MHENTKIAYQNKDILSKAFAEGMKGKSLEVYGVHLPKVKMVISANLPAVEVNELRLDDIFILEDDSFAIIDYESQYLLANKMKYLGYVLRVVKRLMDLGFSLRNVKLRVIVIYTGNIKRGSTKDMLDLGAVKIYTHEAYLSELDAPGKRKEIEEKIKSGAKPSEEDIMVLCVMALSHDKREEQQREIRELVELAKEIKDEETQRFTLGAILGFTDKVMEPEVAQDIVRRLTMTKVARIYEEMRLEYGKQEAEKARKEAREEARKEAREETRIDTMYDMILRFMNKNQIKLIQAMDDLGISEADRSILMQRF